MSLKEGIKKFFSGSTNTIKKGSSAIQKSAGDKYAAYQARRQEDIAFRRLAEKKAKDAERREYLRQQQRLATERQKINADAQLAKYKERMGVRETYVTKTTGKGKKRRTRRVKKTTYTTPQRYDFIGGVIGGTQQTATTNKPSKRFDPISGGWV